MSSQTTTILVTDLVGSTELRSRLGDEQAERLRRLHDRLLRTSVETHGGMIVKGLGDGVLARFPEASGAVAAAVAIQQATDAHTRRHPDVPLVLRVGLSAGDVTVDDGDCFGTPVIEASRLCAAAQRGQILAAEVVRLLAKGRGGHGFTAVGKLDLKGLPEPVAALDVAWERGPSDTVGLRFPDLLGAGAWLDFAGRASEIELLTRAWKDAAAGGRRSVLVAGEPGVGKTRLAAEFARLVHEAGGAVLYGRCEEDLGAPYEPFVEALAFFCEHTPAHELRPRLGRYPGELTRLLPELGDLVAGLDPPLRSDPETEQYRLFEGVASWLAAAGEVAGLLLVVDDLHWAPPPTLRLLAHVARSAEPARVLVVATFRHTDIGPTNPLAPVLADLRRTTGVERISLEGLSIDELAELLGGLPQTGRALATTLYEGTEGNPFFVGEILRHGAESGIAVDTLPVPEGVREVVVSRVARLAPKTGELLGVASVLGRNLELGPLAGVAGLPEDAALEALDEALAARLVEETGVGVYRFVHALVRSALYDTLSATRRARLHLRAADVLEQAGGEDAARLAHHLLASAPLGDSTRTARACLAAGDRALSVLADAEAGDWYSQGLAFAEGDPHLRIDLLTGLGEAQRRTGEPAFRETLLDAARQAAGQGDATRLVRAVLANNRGITSVVGYVDEERVELIETALDLVGPAPCGERAELLALLAMELTFGVDHERRLAAADEAAAIAARLEDVDVRAKVGLRRLVSCSVPDRVLSLVAGGAEVVRLADSSGDPQLRSLARILWAGVALQHTGNLREARRATSEGLAIAEEVGRPALRSFVQMVHASAVDALGDHAEAARLTQGAFELGQEAGEPDAVMWYGARMFLHFLFEGQADAAAAIAAQAFAEFPRLVSWQGTWLVCLALSNQEDQLADVLARLPDILSTVPLDMFCALALSYFGVAMGFGVEDRAGAAALYDRLLPYRMLHGTYVIGYWGPVEMALGVLARVLGDVDGALAHHEAAAATIEACGAARARALNGYQWAVALLARGAPGDRQRAADVLEETLAYCRAKGYTTFVNKTEELLATVG